MVMTLKEGPLLPSVQNASVSLLTWQLPTLRYHSIPSTGLDALALVMWSSYILWLLGMQTAECGCALCLLTSSLWPTYLPSLSLGLVSMGT